MGAVDARWVEYRRFPFGKRHIEPRVRCIARCRFESMEMARMIYDLKDRTIERTLCTDRNNMPTNSLHLYSNHTLASIHAESFAISTRSRPI